MGQLCLGALLFGATGGVARAADPERPLGVVEIVHKARLDGKDVSKGEDFFAGQEFITGQDGWLQLRIQKSQIEIGASSDAVFQADACPTGLKMIGGYLSFNEPATGGLVIATPAGVVRAVDGRSASGTIVIENASTVDISATGQDLVLDNGGELHVIPAGASYRINVLEAAPEAPGAPPIPAYRTPPVPRKIALYAIGGAIAVFVETEIWEQDSESPYKPKP